MFILGPEWSTLSKHWTVECFAQYSFRILSVPAAASDLGPQFATTKTQLERFPFKSTSAQCGSNPASCFDVSQSINKPGKFGCFSPH